MKKLRNKDWKRYQVDDPIYSRPDLMRGGDHKITVKTVEELTIAEAKNELCKAMDLIEDLADCGYEINAKIGDAGY